jgi:putative membrane protein
LIAATIEEGRLPNETALLRSDTATQMWRFLDGSAPLLVSSRQRQLAAWGERQQRDGGWDMRLFNLSRSFNWRILLVRILVNAVTLVVLAILPGITFVDPSLGKLLLMALVLGLINAIIKPVLQFLTLSFLFVTYGFVLILINAVVLILLARLFQSYQLASIWVALLGGALIGLISSFLESLFGVAPPILPEKPPELKQQIAASQTSPLQAALARKVVPQGQFAKSESESMTSAPSPAEPPGAPETPAADLMSQTAEPGTKQDPASERGGDA